MRHRGSVPSSQLTISSLTTPSSLKHMCCSHSAFVKNVPDLVRAVPMGQRTEGLVKLQAIPEQPLVDLSRARHAFVFDHLVKLRW
jgi:hypothetical protein